MSSHLYRIVFEGEVSPGRDIAKVKRDLAALFKADLEIIEQLFSGRPIVLKLGLDAEAAIQYVSAMSHAGAVSRMEPMPKGAKISAGFIERRQAERRRIADRRLRMRQESLMPDRRARARRKG